MEILIDELIERVWSAPALQSALVSLEREWLIRTLGVSDLTETPVSIAAACRYLEASAILACSPSSDQRLVAYRLATYTYDLFQGQIAGLDASLRVVLTRLGNFPSLLTAPLVNSALAHTPWALAGEEIARRDANSVRVGGISLTLTDYQKKLWTHLSAGDSVAISAPTSAGKSFLLQSFILGKLAKQAHFSACYIVPTRALITQVHDDLLEGLDEHGLLDVAVVTVPVEADEPLPSQAIFVMTQERLQIFLVNHPKKSFDFLVIDEAHSVRDGDRGIILQSAIDELLVRSEKTQVLFATPTVSNLEIFSTMTGIVGMKTSQTDDATVSQNFINVEVTAGRKGSIRLYAQSKSDTSFVGSETLGQSLNSRIECLVHVPHRFGADRQSIVYANGQAEAEKIAFQISDLRRDDEAPVSDELLALAELAREAVHPKYILSLVVKNGVGFHYGNIPTILRNAVEDAFARGHLRYLVCTSTLLSGVNLPARNLFMCHPDKSKNSPLESVDFWNLSGRAGRLRREFQGNIYLIEYDKWKRKALEGPKAAPLTPAIQHVIEDRADDLEAVILNDVFNGKSDAGLQTISLRLITDFKRGRIKSTLDHASLGAAGIRQRLEAALVVADAAIPLSAEVLGASPTVSAHRQQRLYENFLREIKQGTGARALLLRHPREGGAFDSYVLALSRCHGTLIERAGSEKQNRFFALMLLKWMQGISISELVDGRAQYNPSENINTAIRSTLDLVEKELRFNYVRILGCYSAILAECYRSTGNEELVASIPSIALYLEIGASDKTMISFVSLGLSRLVAKKLTDICPNKNFGPDDARLWVERQDLEILGFSHYLRREVAEMVSRRAA